MYSYLKKLEEVIKEGYNEEIMQIYSLFVAPSTDDWWDYAPCTNGADGAEFAHTVKSN